MLQAHNNKLTALSSSYLKKNRKTSPCNKQKFIRNYLFFDNQTAYLALDPEPKIAGILPSSKDIL
ncbi:hypothetical protein CW304_06370 [Bacillus sp. UFRGS-B20]|nr:hypothetical protein CW304_06370 [Bacillus sp. UFRGS-B20]